MPEPIIAGVADTALLVARQRALESARPDALFRDPLAAQLAGERGKDIVERLPPRALSGWGVAIRTVIIDDFITQAVAGGVDTVLSLGAGLDARPYRMALPASLRFIEVDFPAMIELKESRLGDAKPNCQLERVRMDLSDRAARRALLERVAREANRVLVLTEGVVPYLSEADVGELADELARMPNVQGWIVDYIAPRLLRYRRRFGRHFENAPFSFEPADWFGFFEQHGFRAQEKRFFAAEGERLGRPAPIPRWLRLIGRARKLLMPNARARELAGYVLLVPSR
jgi:methyltransferase (TIGR00027 family)